MYCMRKITWLLINTCIHEEIDDRKFKQVKFWRHALLRKVWHSTDWLKQITLFVSFTFQPIRTHYFFSLMFRVKYTPFSANQNSLITKYELGDPPFLTIELLSSCQDWTFFVKFKKTLLGEVKSHLTFLKN